MKLDKYDRMFIAFMFVIVTVISICNCVFASTLTANLLEGYSAYTTIHPVETANIVYYMPVYSGRTYKITKNENFSSTYCNAFFALSIENGTTTMQIYSPNLASDVNVGYSLEYTAPEDGYLLISSDKSLSVSTFSVEDVSESMENTVGSLVDNVGVNQLWGVFENGIDFIGVVVLVAFGLFLVFLLIKKISKGKSDF